MRGFGVCLGFDSRPNFEKFEWAGREGRIVILPSRVMKAYGSFRAIA
jgi:hypothetical protein